MNKIKFLILGMVGIVLLNACSEDYLNTEPTSEIAPVVMFSTTSGAKLAINGINKMMTQQYLGSQGFNGEGTIKMYYGNYPGNHFTVNLPGWASIINSDFHENVSSIYLYYPWYYYYKIIGNANAVIANIDNATGSSAEKAFIKAQALTFRAYSFFMLSQIYCSRWMDSGNGTSDGIVLRTDLSQGSMPLSTLGQTYDQVYADLNNAITLFTTAKNDGVDRSFNYDININVAYAVYARAAITRQDYTTASTMAVNARTGFPLMNETEYKSGFCNPNQEWIWSSFGSSDETLYFFSYFAYIAYNSSASAVRTYPKCISRDLFNQIPTTDYRRYLFLDPQSFSYNASNGTAGTALRDSARLAFPDLSKGSNGAFNGTVYAYMQFKIKANDLPGVGHLNHFRSSEMYLIEAEAKYFLTDEDGARQALFALNSARNPSYLLSVNTGNALLDEIKLYRAIELWGEGFDWFDLKRWGDSVSRRSFASGGSFVTDLAVTYDKTAKNNWIWRIPEKETNYNFDL